MLDGGLIPSLVATFHTLWDSWTKRCVLCGHKGHEHRQGFESTACAARGCGCGELEYAGEDARITQAIREQLATLSPAELRQIARSASPRQALRFERVAHELEARGH
jgi:hypothetical protein